MLGLSLGMNLFGRISSVWSEVLVLNNLVYKIDPVDEAWNSNYYKQLRLDMLAGVKNKNCENVIVTRTIRRLQ
jgi:hypothetical protein